MIEQATETRIRVLFVGHTAKASGGELALVRLIQHLPEVEAHVCLAEDGDLVGMLKEAGATVHVLPLNDDTRLLPRGQVSPGRLPVGTLFQTSRYVMRLRSLIRELKPGVVHTNSLKAGVYGSLAGRAAGVPVVWHVRDRVSPDYLPRPAVQLVRLALRYLPTAVVANSWETLSTTRRPGVVIPSFVPTPDAPETIDDRFSRRGNSPLAVVMVGRIAQWKGQGIVLDAFAKAFPNGDERLTFVGAPLFGEESLLDELRARVEPQNLADRVTFAGHVNDVNSILRENDVLLHASTIPEPFGQVVIEGMANGLTVIASNAGGPTEVIVNGQNGILYPPGDVDALAEVLRLVCRNDDLRRRVGAAALQDARAFTPESLAPKMLAMYRSIAKPK